MNWRERAAHWLREPLVHFLIAGLLVYALMAGRQPDLGERRILVNEAVVSRLLSRWDETFHRVPTQQEIDGLISDYVRDQIYYREALRLDLDKDDEVVMRRMRNKMIALATSDAEASNPSDADLQKLLDKDPARYAPEIKISFTQIYLGADTPERRAAAPGALTRLSQGGPSDGIAQPIPIPADYNATPASEISASFGDEFLNSLRRQEPGKWIGPVVSGLGLHLVKVTARSAPTAPRLADVRQAVENDWRAAALRKAEDDGYAKILSGYDVVIEQPK